MKSLPHEGLYVSTKTTEEIRLIVVDTFSEDPEEFYLVFIIQEQDKGNPYAIREELDYQQWEELCNEYGLEHRA